MTWFYHSVYYNHKYNQDQTHDILEYKRSDSLIGSLCIESSQSWKALLTLDHQISFCKTTFSSSMLTSGLWSNILIHSLISLTPDLKTSNLNFYTYNRKIECLPYHQLIECFCLILKYKIDTFFLISSLTYYKPFSLLLILDHFLA